VLGTRPEAVKMAPVIKALQDHPQIESAVCVTAQHREMLDMVLNLFGITPDFDLDLMRENQSLGEMTAGIFSHLDAIYRQVQPDWVLVQGDTTTVAAAALLAYYHRIRVGHVEAGLRTGDKWQPFPEEINRKVAGVVADLHFAPTEHSRQNLLLEGIPEAHIIVTGNTVIDALKQIRSLPAPEEVTRFLEKHEIASAKKRLILVTAHRRENFGQPLENICDALRELAIRFRREIVIVYPVHLNPQVQDTVKRMLKDVEGVVLLPPLPYINLVHLMMHAALVLTDSGGIQEEATALKVPTLVLRQVTERPEGIEAGVLKLVGTDSRRIIDETSLLLCNPWVYDRMKNAPNPFGDGQAAERIVKAILDYRE